MPAGCVSDVQHQDVHGAVYKPDSIRPAAQQQLLQALHTENLQLKACLRNEVEARQLLEKKHAELLDLLRCVQLAAYKWHYQNAPAPSQHKLGGCGISSVPPAAHARRSGRVLELLASGFITSTSTAAAPPSTQQQKQQQRPTSADMYNRIAAADAVHCSDQALPSKHAASSDASTGMQPPGSTASSSSYTSSAADGDSSHPLQQPGHASAAVHMQPGAGFDPARAPAHSAYFPTKAHTQQQPQLSSQRPQPCLSGQQPHTGYSMDRWQGSSTGAGMASTAQNVALHTASSPAGPTAAPLSSPAAGGPTTWQDSLQSGLFAKLTQHSSGSHSKPCAAGPAQQQQQFSTPPSKSQQQRPGGTAQQYQADQHAGPLHFSTGFEVEGGLLSTSTSNSPSAQSGLLDSEDLDELAGLCDSLLQHRAAAQPQQPSPAAASAGGCDDTHCTPQPQQQQQCNKQQGLAGTAWFGSSSSAGMSQALEQPQDAASSQACVPGLQQLAAQLRQLQEQVSATAMDAAPVHGTSNGSGSFSSGATPPRQASGDNATQHASMVGAAGQAGYDDQHRSSNMQGPQRRGSTGSSCGAGRAQQGSPGFCEGGPAMTSLQQQLAQRMTEVKERLSNICNGMLQDSPPPPAVQGANNSSSIPGSSSFFSPPASPPEQEGSNQPAAAGARSPWCSQPGTVQYAAGSTGRSASEPGKAAAGRLGASGWSKAAGQAGAGRYSAPRDMGAGSKQTHPAPTAAAAAAAHVRGDADPAAAFAAIKASIHSNPDVPGFFTAAPASECRRGVVGGQHTGRGEGRASGTGVPPAAAQASWASTDDAAGAAGTDNSDEGSSSWATVDELEQQASMNEQHGQQRTTTQSQNVNSSSNAEERAASPISCEGSISAAATAGLGRLPAEVVFSPMKSAAPRRQGVQSE